MPFILRIIELPLSSCFFCSMKVEPSIVFDHLSCDHCRKMEHSNGLYNLGKSAHTGRPLHLPPRSVTPSFDTFQAEYLSHSAAESEGVSVCTERQGRHQRTLSADFLQTEEAPSWLTELLDEPETPICRSHRRSSSDSIAFLQTAAEASQRKDGHKKHTIRSSSSSSNLYHPTDQSHLSLRHPISFDASMNASWDLSLASLPCSSGYGSTSSGNIFPSSCASREPDVAQLETIGKQNTEDPEVSSWENPSLRANNPPASKAESKRAKRHSAQQSRARRLKYIAELERSIQVFQQEGSEVSAELEFLDQQNLILGMENRNLKQRLDSLSQERFIKCLEQEMLEKEIARLRNLHQHKQLQQAHPQPQKHYWSKSCDLGYSFSKLSLKNKEPEMQKKTGSSQL